MIDQTSEVINDVASKKQHNSKDSTKRVAPANGSDLERQRLEQKKVDADKTEKSAKEKNREFKKQYADKYNDSKNTKKSNEGKPEYGTYGSNNLSYGIQQCTNPIRNKLLGKSKDKELGEK